MCARSNKNVYTYQLEPMSRSWRDPSKLTCWSKSQSEIALVKAVRREEGIDTCKKFSAVYEGDDRITA